MTNHSSHRAAGSAAKKLIAVLAIISVLLALAIVAVKRFVSSRAEEPVAEEPQEIPAEQAVPEAPLSPPEPAGLAPARMILSGDKLARGKAVAELSLINDPQPDAVSFLTVALSSATHDVKIDVLAGLVALAGKNPESVTSIAGALKDKSVRLDAVKALGALGPTAASSVSALKKIAADPKEQKAVKTAAKAALAKIQPKPAKKTAAKTGKKSAARRSKKKK